MSDTPRTDAAVAAWERDGGGSIERWIYLARQLERDAARFEWALPILTAQGREGDSRALKLASAFMRGMDGRDAVDAAMSESMSHSPADSTKA